MSANFAASWVDFQERAGVTRKYAAADLGLTRLERTFRPQFPFTLLVYWKWPGQ